MPDCRGCGEPIRFARLDDRDDPVRVDPRPHPGGTVAAYDSGGLKGYYVPPGTKVTFPLRLYRAHHCDRSST